MECKLIFQSGKWTCEDSSLFELLESHPRPHPDVEKAIDEFRRRYYSNEQLDDNKYPWKIHASTKNVDELKVHVQSHTLTWHWRLLLPHLRDFKHYLTKERSLVLCVSQIRQWQLVSCFQMDWPDVENYESIVTQLRSRNKALVRPPVFGKSHRISHWEVYASLYAPHVLEQIKKAVSDADPNCVRLANVLGRYDAYIRIKTISNNGAGVYSATIDQIIDLEPEQAPISLCDETAVNVCRPYGLATVPQYPDSGASAEPNNTLCKQLELLFSSDNYCRAFEQISDVLNDANARVVLVIAPPGSGKENLSKLFHTCRIHRGRLIRVSLAGLDANAAANQLFGDEKILGDLLKRIEDKHGEWHIRDHEQQFDISYGAVFKALRGTLVIDEIDKADEKVRGMLLRFLESSEITIPGTSVTVKITEDITPLYVFAGSKPRKEFLALNPIDFWSRVTHIVDMQHPLNGGEVSDRTETAEDYVRLFWLQQVTYYFKNEQLLEKTKRNGKVVKANEDLFEPIRCQFVKWWKFFVSREVGDFVARELAKAYIGQGQPVPSVRTLRVATSRCFKSLFAVLLYNKDDNSPLQIWEKQQRNADLDPIDELAKLIKNLSNAKGEMFTFSLNAFNAIGELQAVIKANATEQG